MSDLTPFGFYDHFNDVMYRGPDAAQQAHKAEAGGNTITALFAAAPSADLTELRALVGKWRKAKTRIPMAAGGAILQSAMTGDDCADELEAWLGRMGDGELARLEREIAKDSAHLMLESYGVRYQVADDWLGRPGGGDRVLFDQAARYFELLGLLERHPEHPDWVRVKESG